MKLQTGTLLLTLFFTCQLVSAQIRTRGLTTDLSNTADRFLSLDLNGDGKADLLYFRPGGGYAGAYLSHGDGTFRSVPYTVAGAGENGFPGDLSNPKDTFVALDLNGDGKSDFIEYRPGFGFATECFSQGDGSVNCSALSTPGGQSLGFQDNMMNGNEHIIAVDLNHDGKSDFIVYTPGGSSGGMGSARAYLSQGQGQPLKETTLSSNGAPNTSVGFRENMYGNTSFLALDLNGDGYSDLLVTNTDVGIVREYFNNKNGTFTLVSLSAYPANTNGFTGNSHDVGLQVIALDLNGDGKSDFLWYGSGEVIGFLSKGDGSVTAVNYLVNGTTYNGFVDQENNTGYTAAALDLNGDGKSDFLWYLPGSSILTAYLSSSTGQLSARHYDSPAGHGNNFMGSTSSPQDIALPLNFLGQAASGFAWYTPGGGLFQAYSPSASTDLNYYSFIAWPATFMSDLSWSIANVPLKELVLPGTHDSAMYELYVGPLNQISQTQFHGFTFQLDSGARAFDFRTGFYVVSNGSVYRIDGAGALSGQGSVNCATPNIATPGFYMNGHNDICTNYLTLDILNEIELWLFKNPKEIVYLRSGPAVAGNADGQIPYADETNAFISLLNQTNHPELIYTQQAACGVSNLTSTSTTTLAYSCNNPAVAPPNVTPAQLWASGHRLIISDNNGPIANTGYAWTSSAVDTIAGYCTDGNYSGIDDPQDEIQCMNSGFLQTTASVSSLRPQYQAADATTTFLDLLGALTPFGYPVNLNILGPYPIVFAYGINGDDDGFNNGSGTWDLNPQLTSGRWATSALNLFYVDAILPDNLVNTLISRNNQTWVNTKFFNSRFPQAAGVLSAGANGDVWAAGTGHSIAVFKYVNGVWKDLINAQPNVKRLAVDAQGGVWLLSGAGQLIHYDQNGANEQATSHYGRDVAVGADGSVWYIGLDGTLEENSGPTNGNKDIYGSVPTQVGTHVAIDNRGYPWVIANDGSILRFNGTAWSRVGPSEASAQEIVASAEGSIFVVGSFPSVFRYNSQTNNFDAFIMDAIHVAVDGSGHPWAIRPNGYVYQGALDQSN